MTDFFFIFTFVELLCTAAVAHSVQIFILLILRCCLFMLHSMLSHHWHVEVSMRPPCKQTTLTMRRITELRQESEREWKASQRFACTPIIDNDYKSSINCLLDWHEDICICTHYLCMYIAQSLNTSKFLEERIKILHPSNFGNRMFHNLFLRLKYLLQLAKCAPDCKNTAAGWGWHKNAAIKNGIDGRLILWFSINQRFVLGAADDFYFSGTLCHHQFMIHNRKWQFYIRSSMYTSR